MEKLLQLGETSRTISTFGIPILTDSQNRSYQIIQPQYEKLLRTDSSFDWETMKAFDFKLKRARGKVWPEPPRIDEELTFKSPFLKGEGELCSGVVWKFHLGHRRSVGLVYLKEWTWLSEKVPDITIASCNRTSRDSNECRRY